MKLAWDKTGERFWETGVSHGVLFPMSETPGVYGEGVVWNGLVNVTESPTGAEPSPIYADNIKYLNLMSVEELELSIEAYTYPDEWAECDGSAVVGTGITIGQQPRKLFAFTWQTKVGNDVNSDLGYKIHIVYGCLASPSERAYDTVNDSPEALTFSWDITTTPVGVTDHKPTALIVIDSTKLTAVGDKAKLAALEEILYGKDAVAGEPGEPAVAARIPLPDEIIALFNTEG